MKQNRNFLYLSYIHVSAVINKEKQSMMNNTITNLLLTDFVHNIHVTTFYVQQNHVRIILQLNSLIYDMEGYTLYLCSFFVCVCFSSSVLIY